MKHRMNEPICNSASTCPTPSTHSINGDVCLLLGKLARKGAVVTWAASTGASIATCEVHLLRGGARTSVVVMPRNVAQRAKLDGLLMPCANGDDWKLSKKGARALRAVRSAGEVEQLKSAISGGQGAPVSPVRQSTCARSISHVRPVCRPGECDQDDAGKGRSARSTVKEKCTAQVAGQAAINDAESPLGWLRRRKGKDGKPLLSNDQYNAGEKLRAEFWLGQMTPRVTANWSAASAGSFSRRNGARARGDIGEAAMSARQRVRRALSAVGPELSGVLIDVCCHLKGLELAERSAGWPLRSGKVVLGLSLSALARHYGMTEDANKNTARAAPIGHWGAGDYRPLFDDE